MNRIQTGHSILRGERGTKGAKGAISAICMFSKAYSVQRHRKWLKRLKGLVGEGMP